MSIMEPAWVSPPLCPEGPGDALTTANFAPPVDVYEDEHNITLKIEVPGIDEKDIDVSIENNTLTVRGERRLEKEEKENDVARDCADNGSAGCNVDWIYLRPARPNALPPPADLNPPDGLDAANVPIGLPIPIGSIYPERSTDYDGSVYYDRSVYEES